MLILRRVRVAFYSETALPKLGGQQVVIDRLARELVALGHGVTLLTPPAPRGLVAEDLGLPYRVVRHPRFVSTTHLVGYYKKYLLRLRRDERFDVLHCHSLYPTAWIASLAKRELGVPLVLTSHGGDVREGGLRLRKPRLHPRYVAGVRAADALVAISRFTREGYLRFDPGAGSRIHDIPNGVDVGAYATPVTRPAGIWESVRAGRYVLFLGRVARQKGVDVALAAIGRLATGLQLVVAGDGPEFENQRRSAPPNAHFVGRVDGATKAWLLQNCLCSVVPSREYEAFGLVVLESYAAGRPVVATDLPGLADLITAETGLVVPPEDPGAMAAAIQGLVDDPGRAGAMGEAGRRAAAAYAWPIIARSHAGLYASLLGLGV